MEQLDKKLNQMNVLEKANKLEALIEKTELDVEYSTQVAWVGVTTDVKTAVGILISNTRKLFEEKEIDSLDPEVKEETYANYSVMLDSYLRMFPEYHLDEAITETVVTDSVGRTL